jgi:site-specific DNA recombinase
MDIKTKPQPAALRVALYSRRSSALQNERSTEQQRNDCMEQVQKRGWEVMADFVDEEMSGHDNNRPGVRAMLEAAKRREFDVLMVWNLSRLARDSADQSQWVKRLEFNGIRVVTVKGGYDSINDPKSNKITRTITGLTDEMQSDDMSVLIHRGHHDKAKQGYWCGGRPYAFKLEDHMVVNKHGERVRQGTHLRVDPQQAKVVVELFERYANGESALAIAADLNRRGIQSAGSKWNLKKRKAKGWQSSSVRAILVNRLFNGWQRWNASQFVRDPDTRKHVRRKRPEAEWVTNQVVGLRIVSDELWGRVQARVKTLANNDPRLKLGGQASKYLLSGLGRCALCGATFQIADARGYACSNYLHGRSCKNNLRAPRPSARLTLTPVLIHLRDPKMVAKMVKHMQDKYTKSIREAEVQAEAAPKALAALDQRLSRLRARLAAGDPDMTQDELQGVIRDVEQKRAVVKAAQPEAKQHARVLALLPKAAQAYAEQLELGIDDAGDPRAVQRARLILRDLIGKITYTPRPDGSLWASYRLNPGILVSGPQTGHRIRGRGDRI